jgi:hypothetical protein
MSEEQDQQEMWEKDAQARRTWPTGPTCITDSTACLMLLRQIEVAARCALGDGIPAATVAIALREMADAIDGTSDVAEDMSPIVIPMA